MNSNSKDGNGNTSLCLSLRTNAEDFRKLLVAGADPFSKEENILEKCVMLDDLSFLNVLLQEQGTTFICNSLFSKFWERQNGVTFLRNRSLIAAVTLQMLSSPKELNVNVINRLRTTPLLYFCEQNEDVVVERLLERGADVNIIDNHGRTALHTVLHSEDKNVRYHILSLLMKKNPDLNIKDASGMTVFQRAMEEYEGYLCNRRTDFKWLSVFMKEALLAGEICGKSRLNFLLVLASHRKHFNFMTILVDKGADLSVKEYQSGILHLCWSRKFHDEERQNESYKEFLDFLLIFKKHGGKLDDVDRNGNTPLLLFLKHGLNDFDDNQDKLVDLIDEIVSLLACDGSTVRKRDKTGLSAIQIVSSKGWLSTMKILVQKGANISEKDDKQNTRRHLCLMGDDIENMVHRILENRANVHGRDHDGRIPLHLAIKAFCSNYRKCNTESIIQQLLDFGANINALDNKGHTPLSLLCETRGKGSSDRASLGCFLLSKGADPNINFVLNKCFQKIECYGLNADWKVFILSLIRNGADPNHHTDGEPTLLLAIKPGHTDIVKYLIEKGANIHSCDRKENTCLHLACDLKAESARNEIASLFLEHGCSVNKPNRYGETPLTNVIKRMTEDTNSMEIDHSEKATVAKVDLSLFNRLICSGAKIDPAVKTRQYYSSISTLSDLLRNGFFGAAATLLKCGYNCKNDKDLKNVDFSNLGNSTIFVKGKEYNRINSEQEKNEFLNVLKKHEEKEATSLSSLCRNAIRMNLIDAGQGAEIESKIMLLHVPGRIKTYLTLTGRREYSKSGIIREIAYNTRY